MSIRYAVAGAFVAVVKFCVQKVISPSMVSALGRAIFLPGVLSRPGSVKNVIPWKVIEG